MSGSERRQISFVASFNIATLTQRPSGWVASFAPRTRGLQFGIFTLYKRFISAGPAESIFVCACELQESYELDSDSLSRFLRRVPYLHHGSLWKAISFRLPVR